MSFGDSWISGTHTRNKAKTVKRCNTIAQNIQPCLTLTKRAHKAGQTDERSPAPTYAEEGPSTSDSAKDGGPRRCYGVGRTPGPAEPRQTPI